MPLEAHSRKSAIVARALGWIGPASSLRAALTLTLALGMTMAAAQDGTAVYRCPDGQYRQSPCPGGRAVDTGTPPTAQQQAEAKRAAATDARLADALRQERHARERSAAGQAPARIGPAPAATSQPGKQQTRKKPKRSEQHVPHARDDQHPGAGSGSGSARPRKGDRPAKQAP